MDRNEFEKIIKACRFCLMCRHLCTVGNITYAETNTPRGHALMIDCMGSEALEDTPENRKRAAEIFFSCSYCGHCRNNCVSTYEHPDAIMMARAGVAPDDLPEKAKRLRALVEGHGGFYENPKQLAGNARYSGKADKPGADVLLYAGSFVRNEAQEIADAAASVFEKAGVSYTILSFESGTGMEAYLVGLPDMAQNLLDDEARKIASLNPGAVVCLSPDDLRVFSGGVCGLDAKGLCSAARTEAAKEENADGIPVFGFSAFALELSRSGKLALRQDNGRQDRTKGTVPPPPTSVPPSGELALESAGVAGAATVSYHDSDQGGRFLQEYDAPREVIRSIPGVMYKELFWTKGEAASAGESGAIRLLDPALGEKIAKKRMEQVEGRGVDVL
ncbi:MAG: (Fe-S)-binding protein, partial [Acidobacteriota bacterium]|nr:(Fe-S)-binding protein [Acidobacteriota bacterium]